MKFVRDFLATVLFALATLALVLILSRSILIPPGSKNVTDIGMGWREFDYKGSRYIISPIGYIAPSNPDHVGQVLEIIEDVKDRTLK